MEKKVLFLCTGNASRSQMAEGLTNHDFAGRLRAWSAGTNPKSVSKLAIRVLAELGIDISRATSDHLSRYEGESFDYVITLCGHAHETCPLFPGPAKIIHAGFDDPPKLAENARNEEEAMSHYRRVRDEIRAFVERLPGALKEK